MAKASTAPVAPVLPSALMPTVRLAVRSGGRTTSYEVGEGGFLIGSVPGCDLRLPGSNLPPVLCLISQHPGGVSLRKLAPVQPILVNGQPFSTPILASGDKISLGTVEVALNFDDAPTPAVAADPAIDERFLELEEREKQLSEQATRIEADRLLWQQRRQEIEADCELLVRSSATLAENLKQKEEELEAAHTELETREQELEAAQTELQAREQDLLQQIAEMEHQRQGLDQTGAEAGKQHVQIDQARRELDLIRTQLAERYQIRRDRVAKKEQAVRNVARKLRDRKEEIEHGEGRLNKLRQDWALREAELEARAEQVTREKLLVEERARLVGERHREGQRELAERAEALKQSEAKLAEERQLLDLSQKQHKTDLVRLDRLQATAEQKQLQLRQRALEVDRSYEQLQRDTRDLEEQALQLDEAHQRLEADKERLILQKKEQDATRLELSQRGGALEGQQTMLATLRSRLEKMREEMRRQEQVLSEQRAMQEATENELRQRLDEANKLRSGLDNDQQVWREERRRMEERQVTLDAAVAQLRQAQESFDARAAELEEREALVNGAVAEQAEQSGLILARGSQLEQLHARIEADRVAFKEREGNLTRSEQALAALQESLRRRGDELSVRQKNLDEREQKLLAEATQLQAKTQAGSREIQETATRLEALRQELNDRATEFEKRQESVAAERQQLDLDLRVLSEQRQSLTTERLSFELERQTALDAAERTRAELEAARGEALEMGKQIPELETRVASATERLLRSREQLREYLAEIHTYARQSRDDLEAARQHIQAEQERVQHQERDLNVARDEHRLAVTAFRQQLIEWQGRVAEMKQALVQGETRLDRRQAEVEQQAQQLQQTAGRLARESVDLQEQHRLVAEQRGTMDRHLNDMREWYRKKMREISGIDREIPHTETDAVFMALPAPTVSVPTTDEAVVMGERDILSVTGDIEPGDRKLGDLLLTLALIDRETLTALLIEARRQRKTLRQLLLAGNFMTLYQMALIEAGNVDGLMLGPVRVVDRVQATPHEAVYRVFDPRSNGEALLRHLAESEMGDAVRPDEFRQRFAAAAAVRHENLAATYEVLDIADRPAALQEWLTGLPAADWPAQMSAPGVFFRLLAQAVLGLQAAHDAGLIHGHLHPGSFVITGGGVLKILGLGEPNWLTNSESSTESTVADDLLALGGIVTTWAGSRKGFPESLQMVLTRLQTTGESAYPNAVAVLEDLDHISPQVPSNPAAWDRFVKQIRDHAVEGELKRTG